MIKSVWRKLKYRVWLLQGIAPKYTIDLKINNIRHGSVYGGWSIVPQFIKKNDVIYSLGVGYDITFDLEVIEHYGAEVFAFDPTERVEEWVNSQKLPEQFHFQKLAISSKDGFLEFVMAEDENHLYESDALLKSNEKKEVHKVHRVEAKTISTLMNELGHHSISVLKMDIEGSEYEVLDQMFEKNILPTQLLVEFHHFRNGKEGVERTQQMIEKIKSKGYKLFAVSDLAMEFSFLKSL